MADGVKRAVSVEGGVSRGRCQWRVVSGGRCQWRAVYPLVAQAAWKPWPVVRESEWNFIHKVLVTVRLVGMLVPQ